MLNGLSKLWLQRFPARARIRRSFVGSGLRREFLGSLGKATLALAASSRSFSGARNLKLSLAAPALGGHDRLQPDWYRKKIRQVQEQMERQKLDAMLLLDSHNIIYTTGYFHIPTERPLAVVIPKTGDPALFIPELELDQVKLWWV